MLESLSEVKCPCPFKTTIILEVDGRSCLNVFLQLHKRKGIGQAAFRIERKFKGKLLHGPKYSSSRPVLMKRVLSAEVNDDMH